MQIPPELERVRDRARRAIAPLKPLDSTTDVDPEKLFTAQRTNAGRQLPPYYLVYFLLVDLLGFKNSGQFEKVAWSVKVDWRGRAFVIEHRKMGVGVFAQDLDRDEIVAREIVIRIQKAARVAEPFFDWLAQQAVEKSAVNVVNISSVLFDRYAFLRECYRDKLAEFERRKDERIETRGASEGGSTWTQVSFPAYRLRTEADWLALSAVEAFFAWTEHVLIHVAILLGRVDTADSVTKMAEAEWSEKFRTTLDVADSTVKEQYDHLLSLRRELRNYVAHGAFGKQGEAFSFHSGAGAVPVLLPHKSGTRKFKFAHGLSFRAAQAFAAMDEFCSFIWSGARAPAEIYIQRSGLPTILTYASDGTYSRIMSSVSEMETFTEHLTGAFDRAADMDW